MGSSVKILYKDVFEKLGIDRARLKPTPMPLVGFIEDKVEVEGTVELNIELGSYPNVLKTGMEFVVVNISCVHNVLLGRSGIAKTSVFISMTHLCMKLYTQNGIGVVKGNQKSANATWKSLRK